MTVVMPCHWAFVYAMIVIHLCAAWNVVCRIFVSVTGRGENIVASYSFRVVWGCLDLARRRLSVEHILCDLKASFLKVYMT